MAEKLTIDYSEEWQDSIAETMLDNHDPLGALKMLNRNRAQGGDSDESYAMYAEAYDDMELYEKCINSWFMFLDNSISGDHNEAYEGLAVAYMNLGHGSVAAYYYDKLLADSPVLSREDREMLLKTFLEDEKNPLKIAYPPEKADFSDEITAGMELMRYNRIEDAAEEFGKVSDGNPEYLNARNYIAMGHIISGNYELAEEECAGILERDPENIHAMISLAAIRSEQGRREESTAYAEKLLALGVTDPDEIYKIATVCCENGMHDAAYKTFCRLGDAMRYDFNMLYFKAVAANNSGRAQIAADILQTMITIYPAAYTADYCLKEVRRAIRADVRTELSYFYRMPAEIRERNIKTLIDFDAYPASRIKSFPGYDRIEECVRWCLDEADSRTDKDMYRIAASCAVKAGCDGIVREMLLNAFLPDDLKLYTLQNLGMRNRDDNFGVVCCNLLRSVDLFFLDIGRNKHKAFVTAYADLVCRFGIMDESYSGKLAEAAEKLYRRLEKNGRLSEAGHLPALTAAVFALSKLELRDFYTGSVAEFFGADPAKVRRLTEV